QLAYENAKINPHFLSNTLQFIYKEVEQISAKAEEAIWNLSEMMRFLLATPQPDHKTQFRDEIKMLDLYLEMSEQRKGAQCRIRYIKELSERMDDHRIPPHLLLTLAENMIKHGVMDSEQYPATMYIGNSGNTLTVVLKNEKATLIKVEK